MLVIEDDVGCIKVVVGQGSATTILNVVVLAVLGKPVI